MSLERKKKKRRPRTDLMLEADTFFSPQKLGLKMLIAVLVFSSQLHMTYSSPCSSNAAAA